MAPICRCNGLSDTRKTVIIALALGAAAALLYAPTCAFGYVWDDLTLIPNNPWITSDAGLWRAMAADSHLHIYWRPFTMGTLWLGYHTGGGTPWVLHLMQICLHGIATALVFVWLYALVGRRRLAALAALLFALHPMNVESVAFIAARDNILMLIGVLTGALACELQRRNASAWKSLSLFAAGALLAMGSKESGALIVGIPLIYALRDTAEGKRTPGHLLRWSLPTALAAIVVLAYGVMRSMVLTNSGGGGTLALNMDLPARVAHHIGFLATRALLPIGRNPDYYHGLEKHTVPDIIAGFAAAAGIAASGVVLWQRRRFALLTVLAVTLLLSLPFIGIILPSGRTFSESWLYSLLPGVCLLWAGAIEYLFRRRGRVAGTVVLVLLLAWFITSDISGMALWRNQDTLTAASLAADPENPRALHKAGVSMQERGDSAGAQKYFVASIAADPTYGYSYESYAVLFMLNGYPDRAEAIVDRGMTAASWFVRLRGLKARLLMNKGDARAALEVLQSTPADHYSFTEYGRLMAEALMRSGQQEKGLLLLRQYLRNHPRDPLAEQLLEHPPSPDDRGNP